MTGLRIENAIDMHCHFGPETFGRNSAEEFPGSAHAVTALQAATEALESGHKALVLKSLSLASPTLAFALQEMIPGLKIFGGVCTDNTTGGLNLDAVYASLVLGAKIVWLPTIHSHQDYLNGKGEIFGTQGEGLKVVDEDGSVSQVTRDIFAMVRDHDAILATGHVTAAEHYAVVKEFAREGKVLVTHAGEELAGPKLTNDQCRELADLGATIELTALSCDHVHDCKGKSHKEMAQMIEHIGHERCTLSSDYGWGKEVPNPAPGLHDFLERLWKVGVSESQLQRMASTNPAGLLGI